MKKIAGVVILYYPDEEATLRNIASYSSKLDRLYLMDNSEQECRQIKARCESGLPGVTYFHDGNNLGIASRLNFVTDLARAEGFEWLLTMDQDSSFSNGMFELYTDHVQNFGQDHVAIFAVNYQPEIIDRSLPPREVLSTITSGSIVSLSANKIIGKYNEDLFIDLVDAEYCYKAIAAGFTIVLFPDIILNHRIGYIQYGRSLKNFKLTPRILHNPVRIYYIVRNSFYMLSKFPNLPPQARKEIWKCLGLLKNNILYHKKRMTVLKNIIKGYVDYKRNRMGKLA